MTKTLILKDQNTEWVLFHIVNSTCGKALGAAISASKQFGISEAEFYKIRNELISELVKI